MTEQEIMDGLASDVPRETMQRLCRFVELLSVESTKHNLIASSTLSAIWQRHIRDSAQLMALAPLAGSWIDIGSGAGLPGMVVAIMADREVVLIEPRRLRAMFLEHVIAELRLGGRVRVVARSAEQADAPTATVISARAVASLDRLFRIGIRFACEDTVWLLPKGRSAAEEVVSARKMWHADITMAPSLTSSESMIVVARSVRRR